MEKIEYKRFNTIYIYINHKKKKINNYDIILQARNFLNISTLFHSIRFANS